MNHFITLQEYDKVFIIFWISIWKYFCYWMAGKGKKGNKNPAVP